MEDEQSALDRRRCHWLDYKALSGQAQRTTRTDLPDSPARAQARAQRPLPDTRQLEASVLATSVNNAAPRPVGAPPTMLLPHLLARRVDRPVLHPPHLPPGLSIEPHTTQPSNATAARSFTAQRPPEPNNHPASSSQDHLNTTARTQIPLSNCAGATLPPPIGNLRSVDPRPEPASQTASNLAPPRGNPTTSSRASTELPMTRYVHKTRKTELRIQADVRLIPKSGLDMRQWGQVFVQKLAKDHNEQVPSPHPRMLLKEHTVGEVRNPKSWYLSLGWHSYYRFTPHDQGGYDSEAYEVLVSPVFRPCEPRGASSTWQEDIRATWKFLNHNYHLARSTHPNHRTRIDIAHKPPLDFGENKRLMQSFLFFDPVLVAMTSERIRCPMIHSRHIPVLPSNEAAAQAIRAIEAATDPDALDTVLTGVRDLCDCRWATIDMGLSPVDQRRWIQFWQAPACTSAAEAIEWADFALSFVQACLACTSASALLRLPRNLLGLRAFMTKRCNGYQQLYGTDVILTTNFGRSNNDA